jgi:hypothetical protein
LIFPLFNGPRFVSIENLVGLEIVSQSQFDVSDYLLHHDVSLYFLVGQESCR